MVRHPVRVARFLNPKPCGAVMMSGDGCGRETEIREYIDRFEVDEYDLESGKRQGYLKRWTVPLSIGRWTEEGAFVIDCECGTGPQPVLTVME